MLKVLTWAFLPLLLPGCATQEGNDSWTGWVPVPVHAAEHFQLWQRDAHRMLVTFGPGGTTDTTGLFILGPDVPDGPLPHGAVQLGPALERVALMSTTHASFMSALGRASAVVGCAYTDRLRDTAVSKLATEGLLMEIADAVGPDRERILLLAPDALLTYPYGSTWNRAMPGAAPQVPIAEYLEPHPLGRAEWLRAFGLLLNEQHAADSIYQGIVQRYVAAKARVPKDGGSPAVFFGSAWKGTWSVPAGNSYMAHLIADAGGGYLFAARQAHGNLDIDLESVLQAGGKARYWGRILDQAEPVSAADVAGHDARVLALPVFQERGGFHANSAVDDLFGKAGLEPDAVLLDLIAIFHPGAAAGHVPVYFRPVQ